MSNDTVTKDEFETVKQLLASAASYAESASRQSDQNTQAIRELRQAQREEFEAIGELRLAQQTTEERLQSFLFESQRLLGNHAERIQQLEGISERLEAILSYLIRKEGPGE